MEYEEIHDKKIDTKDSKETSKLARLVGGIILGTAVLLPLTSCYVTTSSYRSPYNRSRVIIRQPVPRRHGSGYNRPGHRRPRPHNRQRRNNPYRQHRRRHR